MLTNTIAIDRILLHITFSKLSMETLGQKLRKQRRKQGLSLEDLANKTGISKPYLSLIETGRVPNPPSDEKLRKLEQTLSFETGELLGLAHLMRTPRDIRAMLASLARQHAEHSASTGDADRVDSSTTATADVDRAIPHVHATGPPDPQRTNPAALSGKVPVLKKRASNNRTSNREMTQCVSGLDLDQAYLSGVLHQLADSAAGNVEPVRMNPVPIINRVSAGYPTDFTDLSYPRGIADEFVGCPDVSDPDAFAARVHGDSMHPKYTPGDIVIFSPAATCRNGDDCFVRFEDGQTTFKRVFFERTDSDDPIIRLQPRNEKYRAQTVAPDQITGLYRAMYRYQAVEEL